MRYTVPVLCVLLFVVLAVRSEEAPPLPSESSDSQLTAEIRAQKTLEMMHAVATTNSIQFSNFVLLLAPEILLIEESELILPSGMIRFLGMRSRYHSGYYSERRMAENDFTRISIGIRPKNDSYCIRRDQIERVFGSFWLSGLYGEAFLDSIKRKEPSDYHYGRMTYKPNQTSTISLSLNYLGCVTDITVVRVN